LVLYEEWDVTIPPQPSRSRLYRLEPIGIGTSYVESLTSYIMRLAERHCLSPKNLVIYEILPVQNRPITTPSHYFRLGRFWTENSAALNSVGPLARQWVETIQLLTARDDLHGLTMLTWGEVIALKRTVRRSKAWCAECYEQWRRSCQTVYEPLLWSLNGIDMCPLHRHPLVDHCPQCQKSLPFLTQISRPGYCSHCACWLGKNHGTQEVAAGDTAEWKQKLWNVEVGGGLLAAAPRLTMVPPKEQIATMIQACLDHYTRGNMSALARLLKVDVQIVWGYLYHEDVPAFNTLLNLCYLLSIPPLEFLTGGPDMLQARPRLAADRVSAPSRSRGIRIKEYDILRMRQALEKVLGEEADPFPSLQDLARDMGYHSRTLSRHCPELCREVNKRYRRRWTSDESQTRVRKILESALAAEECMPLKAVAEQLDCDTTTLRNYFPDLCCAIVTRYRQRVDYELIRYRLEQILSRNEPVPSIAQVAREMGYERSVFWNNFPQLCKQVSARRRAEQRDQRKERLTGICKEIRRATFTLHSQGIYPSARQVFQQLGDPHVIRTKEGHEAWCQALEELAYPTDHLKKYT
jgi:AraC-like DNA-binding protein